MANTDNRPMLDTGVPYRQRPYVAGGAEQGSLSDRKGSLLGTGTIGHVPGHDGTGYGSSAQAGYVHEEPPQSGPVPGSDELEYAGERRPMPREQPVHAQTTHMGTIVRYLDGHSEIHRERPGLVEEMNDPYTHPDDAADLRAEIDHRDSVHQHRFW